MKIADFFSNKRGVVLSRFEHFTNECKNCSNNKSFEISVFPDNFRSVCKEPPSETKIIENDIIIYLNYPYTIKNADKKDVGKIVSSNYLILRPLSKLNSKKTLKILRENVIFIDKRENKESLKIEEILNYEVLDYEYILMTSKINLDKKLLNFLKAIVISVLLLFVSLINQVVLVNITDAKNVIEITMFITLTITVITGIEIIAFLFVYFMNLNRSKVSKTSKRLLKLKEVYNNQLISLEEYEILRKKIIESI